MLDVLSNHVLSNQQPNAAAAAVDLMAGCMVQYVYPRTLVGRPDEGVALTLYYPRINATVAAALDFTTATKPASFAVHRVEELANGHLQLWIVFGTLNAPGKHSHGTPGGELCLQHMHFSVSGTKWNAERDANCLHELPCRELPL